MNVPFNDLSRAYAGLAAELESALLGVARGGWYLFGEPLARFEEAFSAYCGCKHGIGVANGTDALELAMRAVGCGPGDEVILAANAGFYGAAACLAAGATPVFADVDKDSLTLAPDSVAGALSERTRAVVATHLYGKLADMNALRTLLDGKGVALIEDCAQAHGAQRGGVRAGAFGDVAAFSFYPTKNLGALGDAGMVLTPDDVVAERLRMLRQYGWPPGEKYHAVQPGGRNSRMDDLQAALLLVKLPHLDAWNDARRHVLAQDSEAAGATPLRMVHRPAGDCVAHLCVGRHPERGAFRQRMAEAGVQTALHYPRLDTAQPALHETPWRGVDLPVSRQAVREVVSLPCYPELTRDEVAHVCRAIRENA